MPIPSVQKTQTSDRILITGASGGLGSAVALHYASPGARLLLWGRDAGRLEGLAQRCRDAGAEAAIRSLDIADCAAAIAAIEEDDAGGPIGLIIFASGLGDIQAAGDLAESPAQVARLAAVNFAAPAAMAAAIAARMAVRGRGRIVLIGSAAAFHALPFAATYAASKAGLARFAQALRLGMAKHGVYVTLVSPGFIDTASGRRNASPRPFQVQPAGAAARIASAAARGTGHLIFPWPFVLLQLIDRMLPGWLCDRMLLALAPPPG